MKLTNLTKKGIRRFLRPIGLACILSAAALPAAAEEVNLKVELKNGKTDVFVLADKPVITFSDASCVISCKTVDTTYDMADIVSAYFSTGNSSADENLAEGVSVDLTDPAVAVVSGLAPGAPVTLFSIDGVAVVTVSADASGVARISLDSLAPRTVYIVSVNSAKNFKFYKK